MLTRSILLTVLILLPFLNIGQTASPNCGFEETFKNSIQNDPDFSKMIRDLNVKILAFDKSKLREKSTQTIPVVVHLMVPPQTSIGEGNNLTDNEVFKGLEYLNGIFSNAGSFQSPSGVDVGIEFCLAKTDPLGRPTTGITRNYTDLVADFTCTPFGTDYAYGTQIKSLNSWDCSRYLNIWLVTDLFNFNFGCSLAGFATFPGGSCVSDGVMQESRYWNDPNEAFITAHEVGHYLGLYHTFNGGCSESDCSTGGDRVCDTPPDSSPSFSPCNTNSCSNDVPDLIDDNYNFMDYTSCSPHHFTQGQSDRMRAVLETERRSLCESNACNPPIKLDLAIYNKELPEEICGRWFCATVEIQNKGIDDLISCEISILVNGLIVHTENWLGSLSTGGSDIVDLTCIELNPGAYDIQTIASSVNGQTDQFLDNNSSLLRRLEIFEIPSIRTLSIEPSRCGFNGAVELFSANGTPPFIYGSENVESANGKFFDLNPGLSIFTLEDSNGCLDTISVQIPDECPPCISGVINNYASVESFCEENLSVDKTEGFEPGDNVLIIQAQGAIANLENTANFGQVIDYRSAGIYEINKISRVHNNVISLAFELLNEYNLDGNVQLVTIPNLGNADLCNLTCSPWNGKTGGVLIFEGDSINLVGNLDVSGKGFRGGTVKGNSDFIRTDVSDYIVPNERFGAERGEGIVVPNNNLTWGRGALANGGGGGNSVNGGGGGGSHIGAGGLGGTYIDKELFTRGLGGRQLPPDGKRLFFGGGGGAGHDNNFRGESGAQGGGIILALTNILYSEPNIKVLASGADARETGIDGGGGGGGAGCILINGDNIASEITFTVNGGKGSDNHSDFNQYNSCHGTGGGGGGGKLLIPVGGYSQQSLGGLNGETINNTSSALCSGKPSSGYASGGQEGLLMSSFNTQYATVPINREFEISIDSTACSGFKTIRIDQNNMETYEYSFNGGLFGQNNTFDVDQTGTYKIGIKNNCFELDTFIKIKVSLPLESVLVRAEGVNCLNLGLAVVRGFRGISPYEYRINGGNWQSEGVFQNLIPGNYTIEIKDSNDCIVTEQVQINDLTDDFKLRVDSMQINIICGVNNTFISVEVDGGTKFYTYTLDNIEENTSGIFTGLYPGQHLIFALDEYGCASDTIYFDVELDTNISTNIDTAICQGSYFDVGQTSYFESGMYNDTIKTLGGCDSIIYTDLEVLEQFERDSLVLLCAGDSIFLNGQYHFDEKRVIDSFIDENGCLGTFNYNLVSSSVANSAVILKICPGDSVRFNSTTYYSFGEYSIRKNNSLGCDSIINLKIVAEKEDRCSIGDCNIYIPNSFSPNADNLNDYFEVYSKGVTVLKCLIYNRWGDLCYQSVNSFPSWDGSYLGKELNSDIYIYVIEVMCSDGSINVFSGDVLLVR